MAAVPVVGVSLQVEGGADVRDVVVARGAGSDGANSGGTPSRSVRERTDVPNRAAGAKDISGYSKRWSRDKTYQFFVSVSTGMQVFEAVLKA